MKHFFFLFFLILCFNLNSQVNIVGNIVDDKGKQLEQVNVIVKNKATNDIISFATTDTNGYYNLSLETNENDLEIQVKSYGYIEITEPIQNKNQVKNFKLYTSVIDLEEVIIENSGIIQKEDTLKYIVNTFSKSEDRSIGDVIKRLPGIEVLPDGQILYQGKAINKYYIEGLDLLEGRYNLVNENLPYKDVAQVQILENHQPVKLLDTLKLSNQAALNIKLKKNITFSGKSELGFGFSPLLWDLNLTPMFFSKKNQFLGSYQTTNSGNNITRQLEVLTLDELFNPFEKKEDKVDWLSIQNISNPPFLERRWLDNKSHVFSINSLTKLSKNYELKSSVSYINDYINQEGNSITQIFTPENKISIKETIRNNFQVNSLQTSCIIEKNTNRDYFYNKFEFLTIWENQLGVLNFNDNPLNQRLTNNFYRISNTFKKIILSKKNPINFNSFFSFNKTPQQLKVNPNQFNIFNYNENDIIQNVQLKSFFINNSINLIKKINKIVFDTRVGFLIDNQILKTNLSNSISSVFNDEYTNNLQWFKSKYYFETQTQSKIDKFTFDISLPLNFYNFFLKDNSLSAGQNLKRLVFEPNLIISYDINNQWKSTFIANLKNQFGDISQLHYGYILQGYRNLVRFNSSIPQTTTQNYSINIGYKNPIHYIFCYLNYSYSLQENNLLYQSNINENGTTELLSLNRDNYRVNHSFTSKFQKKINKLNTYLNLGFNYSFNTFNLLLNDNLSNISNSALLINNKIETDITQWLTLEYQTNLSIGKNKINNKSNATVWQQNHFVDLKFNLNKIHYFSFESEYFNNNTLQNNKKYYFLDFNYRFTLKEKNVDFEFNLYNIFNKKNFTTLNINEFNFIETNFSLRQRQFLFKIRFNI